MQYPNPLIPGFNPDPSIVRVGDDYYLATSTFEYLPGVPIYHSRDLVSWQLIGHVATRLGQFAPNIPTNLGAWAPTIRFHDGVFYVVITDAGGRGTLISPPQIPPVLGAMALLPMLRESIPTWLGTNLALLT